MEPSLQDDWDFYPCLVDGDHASIFVNLGLMKVAPIQNLSSMAYVRVQMRNPQENGLSSQEEYPSLLALEDSMLPRLVKPNEVTYVGRNTSGGCRDFYFYVAQAREWNERVASAMSEVKEYQYEAGTREDSQWTVYSKFLYPSERSMQRIQNRRTCDALASNGDDPSKDREIDHWVYFQDSVSRDDFVKAALKQGFQMRCITDPSDEEDESYGAQIFRTDSPNDIDTPVFILFDLASNLGGDYDGWECPVVG
jgi:uncharacterized protein (TIGR01619 family)